jgi:hypothetical protein
MVPNGKKPVIRAAGTSLQMRSKREGFYQPQDNDISTTLIVLLPNIASEMYFLPGAPRLKKASANPQISNANRRTPKSKRAKECAPLPQKNLAVAK